MQHTPAVQPHQNQDKASQNQIHFPSSCQTNLPTLHSSLPPAHHVSHSPPQNLYISSHSPYSPHACRWGSTRRKHLHCRHDRNSSTSPSLSASPTTHPQTSWDVSSCCPRSSTARS